MSRFRVGILAFGVLALSACASSKVSQSAAAFGTQADQAATNYGAILDSYVEERTKAEKADTILRRVDLVLTDECDTALFDSAVKATACDFVPATSSSNLGTDLEAKKLRSLAKALAGYGAALALISGDFSDGDDALLKSLTEAGAAAIELEIALQALSGKEEEVDGEQLNLVTSAFAKMTSRILEIGRDRVLLDLIVSTDDTVQQAADILSTSVVELRGVLATESARELNGAMRAYSAAIAKGRKLTKPYAAVEAAVEQHRKQLSIDDPFAALSLAHSKLRSAAQGGFSREDYQAFITAMIDVASSLQALDGA